MYVIKNNFLIMTDEIQQTAIEHLKVLSTHPAFKNQKVRIMPDYHEGIGAVIGFTSTYKDLIICNVVGVDIGCGVLAYNLGKIKNISFEALDSYIRKNIPIGFHHRDKVGSGNLYAGLEKYGINVFTILQPKLSTTPEEIAITEALEIKQFYDYRINSLLYSLKRYGLDFTKDEQITSSLQFSNVSSQLGTLGGGNHFIELDKDEENNIWIVIHTGSRNFGLQIANIFQKLANHFREKFHINVEKDLAYLPLDLGGKDYLTYMGFAQRFAMMNRRVILQIILKFFNKEIKEENVVESVHNYIDTEHKIIRKGAIELRKDMKVVIPLNMRDGTIIGIGKDNKDLSNWNFSAPHGAGRRMGRKEAKKRLNIDDYKKEMTGIYSTSVNKDTIDESPMAYKSSKQIIKQIENIVVIKNKLVPIYNLKADN